MLFNYIPIFKMNEDIQCTSPFKCDMLFPLLFYMALVALEDNEIWFSGYMRHISISIFSGLPNKGVSEYGWSGNLLPP